jgi:hypothetical protein
MAFALLVIASAGLSGVSAALTWRTWRELRALRQRYAEALALIALAARAEPAIAAPELRASCERLLTAHQVTARLVSNTIH